jgi:hypothetical protein
MIQFVPRSKHFSSLKTKRKLFHIKTQSVPRSKHFSSQLQKQINLFYVKAKVAVCYNINTKHINTVGQNV